MGRDRTSRGPYLLLRLSRAGGDALHSQIERALREGIAAGRLAAGEEMPSTRELALQLGISRGVVVEAYAQLAAEAYLVTRPGAPTVVAAAAGAVVEEPLEEVTASPRFDFRPGLPDLTRMPREEWARAVRKVLRETRSEELGYGDPRGAAALRGALAAYLGRVRGVLCAPSRVVVCNGFAQALGLVARALAIRGARRMAMEEPGHLDQRRIVAAAGLEPVPVPVDADGLRTDALRRTRADAVLVTPAHQFPTGSVLAPGRRRELLAWAESSDAFVIEDDYDAEYRYDREPVGALQGLAPARVFYAGSASKLLAPALRLGWVVCPPELVAEVAEEKRLADLGSSLLEQKTHAELLRSGAIDRHLRRMRGLYRRRRDALLAALARHCPDWQPQGAAAGLHLTLLLPPGSDERRLVAAAAERSVRVYPLSDYRSGKEPGPPAVVMGYAGLTERQIAAGVSRLPRR